MTDVKVFVPIGSETHQWLQCISPADTHALTVVGDREVGGSWPEIRVRLISADDRGRKLQSSNLLWLGAHVFAMTAAMRDQLVPVIGAAGEFSRLHSDDGEFWIFSPHIRDVLDTSRAQLAYFSGAAKVMYVSSYAFREDALHDCSVFRIPQLPHGTLYCVKGLADQLRDSGGGGVTLK